MVNWKVRLKSKTFWITILPLIILLITQIADVLGFHIDLSYLQEKMLSIVSVVFLILGVLGIVNDPTTAGLSDSEQALTYDKPKDE